MEKRKCGSCICNLFWQGAILGAFFLFLILTGAMILGTIEWVSGAHPPARRRMEDDKSQIFKEFMTEESPIDKSKIINELLKEKSAIDRFFYKPPNFNSTSTN
ncbi:hypothetical protein SFRURICE_001875 [Spodoptera frugiperda]|nr:hypothetical protein SFRURICE_001875 [Spodoptera frugiperda]